MKRTISTLLLALPLGIACTGTTSCSATPKGSLVLAISTDMQAPKDVDLVSVFITSNSVVKFDYLGRVLPDGTVALPATLAIVEPDDPAAEIRIRVIAFQEANARVLRDVITTVPHGTTSLLRMPLNVLDDGSAIGQLMPNQIPGTPGGPPEGDNQQFDPIDSIMSSCPFGKDQTSVNGSCVDSHVDSTGLPPYEVTAVYGAAGQANDGTPASCFDTQGCFAAAVPVTGIDMAHCMVPLPAGMTSGPVVSHDGGAPAADDGGAISMGGDASFTAFPDASTGGGGGGTSSGGAPALDSGVTFTDAGTQSLFRPLGLPTDTGGAADASAGATGGSSGGSSGTAGTANAMVNFALVTTNTGACNASGQCFVPLENDPLEGWTIQGNMVHMIGGICKALERGGQLYMSNGACSSKVLSNPVCEPTKVGTTMGGAADASVSAGDASSNATPDAGKGGFTSDGGSTGGGPDAMTCSGGNQIAPTKGTVGDCIWSPCVSAATACEQSCQCSSMLGPVLNYLDTAGTAITQQKVDLMAAMISTNPGGAQLGACLQSSAMTCLQPADASAGGDSGGGGSCPPTPGYVVCNVSCVDTYTDNANCGGCGIPCATGTTCQPPGVCTGGTDGSVAPPPDASVD